MRRIGLACGIGLGLAAELHADDETVRPGKQQYTLFNPTPRDLMRPLSADRPDVTESPYTVDAGHFQLEMSFIDFAYDDTDGVRTRTWTAAPMNLKLGILNNVDIQLVLDPYINSDIDESGSPDVRLEGFGDMQLRLKVNIWGNDSGSTALAVMPFIQFPTASDDLGSDRVEGGIIVPFVTDLPNEFSLGLMLELDIVYDDEDDDYTAEFVQTASLSREIAGPLSGYVEYIGVATFDPGEYDVLIGAGLTWGVNDDVQLDGGVIVGLTDDANDFQAFTGITIRI
jgi:hypothetical protein